MHQRMTDMCNSFPSLAGRSGVHPWNAETFALGMRGASNAEKQAAAFVLSVWAGTSHESHWLKGKFNVAKFDVVYALQVWDRFHKDAFLAWCDSPFFP